MLLLLAAVLSWNVWANPNRCETDLIWHTYAEILLSDDGENEYVGLKLFYPQIEKTRGQLEAIIGHDLKNRGEAHITILNPAEYAQVRQTLSRAELKAVLQAKEIGAEQIVPICIGKGEAVIDGKPEQTYFLMVASIAINRVRSHITSAVAAKGGSFPLPKVYNWHITLGFTKRDLHSSDGVIKDASQCVYDIKPK